MFSVVGGEVEPSVRRLKEGRKEGRKIDSAGLSYGNERNKM